MTTNQQSSHGGRLSRPDVVEIPLLDSEDSEVIEIKFDELPGADEVISILTAEQAPLHLWVTLAIEYYRQGRDKEFVQILEQSRRDANINYQDHQEDQVYESLSIFLLVLRCSKHVILYH